MCQAAAETPISELPVPSCLWKDLSIFMHIPPEMWRGLQVDLTCGPELSFMLLGPASPGHPLPGSFCRRWFPRSQLLARTGRPLMFVCLPSNGKSGHVPVPCTVLTWGLRGMEGSIFSPNLCCCLSGHQSRAAYCYIHAFSSSEFTPYSEDSDPR